MLINKWIVCMVSMMIAIFQEATGAFVGVNIGTEISNLPSVLNIVSVLQAHQVKHVRLYDADNQALKLLANTGIEVIVGVPNDQLERLAASQSHASEWIDRNVAAFAPSTKITHIAVGNEVFTTNPQGAPFLVPAMQFLHSALLARNNLSEIKISSPISMDMIPEPFPPSTATFDSNWKSNMVEFLHFLKNTDSSFMLNAHPYYAYTKGEKAFSIDYALFKSTTPEDHIVDPNTLREYSNLFDALVDAAYYSMHALGISSIPITVTESGWPWHGSTKEPYATVENALTYNRNLIQHVVSNPSREVGAYIYELFNEDLRPGLLSEKHWGIILANGTNMYSLSFGTATITGSKFDESYCVAKSNANRSLLWEGLNWACDEGGADCRAIQPGQPCYDQNNLVGIVSYAYNDYYQKKHANGGTCNFSYTAVLTTVDPSHGLCIFTGSPSQKSRSPDGKTPPSSALPPTSSGDSALVLDSVAKLVPWLLLFWFNLQYLFTSMFVM